CGLLEYEWAAWTPSSVEILGGAAFASKVMGQLELCCLEMGPGFQGFGRGISLLHGRVPFSFPLASDWAHGGELVGRWIASSGDGLQPFFLFSSAGPQLCFILVSSLGS
ncbi:hypothetical protein Droror1_Dr00016162, partial [Drosera rotundifolia]